MFQELLAKCYGLNACDLTSYFDDVQIQQTPDYAYGEEIAVRRTGDRFSMANSYMVFVSRLTSGEPPWAAGRFAVADAALADVAPSVPPPAPPPMPQRPTFRSTHASESLSVGLAERQVFLSHAPGDAQRIAKVRRELAARGLKVTSLAGSGDLGASFGEKIEQTLDASHAIVVFWSRESVDSPWVRTAADEGLRRGILVPVLLDEVAPPLGFRNVSAADLSRSYTNEAVTDLVEAVHRIATGTPGTVVYPSPPPYPSSSPYPSPLPPSGPPSITASTAPTRSGWGRMIPAAVAASVAALILVGYVAWDTNSGSPPPDASPAARTVTLPNFVGTASADVEKAAKLIGLTVSMSDGRGAQAPFIEGVVTGQTPAPGSTVTAPGRVELQVAARTVEVPTLVGTTLDSAVAVLDRNGLRLGTTTTQPLRDAKPGTIVRQTQAPGTMVALGTAVDVVVAGAPRSVPQRITLKAEPPVISRDGTARLTVQLSGVSEGIVATRLDFTVISDNGTVFGQIANLVNVTRQSALSTADFRPGPRAPLGPATITVRAAGSSVVARAKITIVE
jgi:hypothetical protein